MTGGQDVENFFETINQPVKQKGQNDHGINEF